MMDRRRFLEDLLLAAAGTIACAPSWAEGVSASGAGMSGSRRLATPDRGGTSSVLALRVLPVAAPPADFYAEMGGYPRLPNNIPSAGFPVEPNLEVLRSLRTDLIVSCTIDLATRQMLESVAPVFDMNIYTGAPGAYERGEKALLKLAQITGTGARGRDYAAQLRGEMQTLRGELRSHQPRPAFIINLDSDGRHMGVCGRNGIMYDVMQMLGIENAWAGSTNSFGLVTAGLESLASRPEADVFYIDYGEDTRVALDTLRNSPFWRALPAVRAGRVAPMSIFEVFGSLPSARQFAHSLAGAYRSRDTTHG